MPIKWSAVKVEEYMKEIYALADLLIEPMQRAHLLVKEAQNIPDLPEYMEGSLAGLKDAIERVKGGISWNKEPFGGIVHYAIVRVRENIPDGAIEAEQASTKHGSTQSMM